MASFDAVLEIIQLPSKHPAGFSPRASSLGFPSCWSFLGNKNVNLRRGKPGMEIDSELSQSCQECVLCSQATQLGLRELTNTSMKGR